MKTLRVSLTRHRGRPKAPCKNRPPTTDIGRQLWCWHMTFLPTQVAGRRFFLYLILDIAAEDDVSHRGASTAPRDQACRPGGMRVGRRHKWLISSSGWTLKVSHLGVGRYRQAGAGNSAVRLAAGG